MNKNENKKSTAQWTHRLFKRPNAAMASHGKTYFAHRYHSHHAALGATPFGAIFSDAKAQQLIQVPDNTDFRQLFERELALSTNSHDVKSTRQYPDIDSLSIATEDSPYFASNKVLNTQCTVLNCYDETLDTKTFRLGRADGQIFDYLPGQYITLSVAITGQEYKRSYSLASSLSHRGVLEITVKRDANGGVVSNWLNDNLKVGDTLNVKGPYGKFSCAKDTPKKILFLAAGSGIVPIMSMLRWLADTESSADVLLILSFRTLYDIIYRDELNLIAAHHKNIKPIITLTKEPLRYSLWDGLTGRISESMIAGLVPDLFERAVYLCGPDAFMAECKQSLQNLNLPAEQLFYESFTVNSPVITSQNPNVNCSAIAQPLRKPTGSYQISFTKSGKTIAADGALTLLELAEKSGIHIDHDCRAGNCSECMVKCLEGRVDMTAQAEIDDQDRSKGWVYACCAYPASNAVLDI
jgi:glycine betaine catabolism B